MRVQQRRRSNRVFSLLCGSLTPPYAHSLGACTSTVQVWYASPHHPTARSLAGCMCRYAGTPQPTNSQSGRLEQLIAGRNRLQQTPAASGTSTSPFARYTLQQDIVRNPAQAQAPPPLPFAQDDNLPERRVDESDGGAYTLDEFVGEYGGSRQRPPTQWLQACQGNNTTLGTNATVQDSDSDEYTEEPLATPATLPLPRPSAEKELPPPPPLLPPPLSPRRATAQAAEEASNIRTRSGLPVGEDEDPDFPLAWDVPPKTRLVSSHGISFSSFCTHPHRTARAMHNIQAQYTGTHPQIDLVWHSVLYNSSYICQLKWDLYLLARSPQ